MLKALHFLVFPGSGLAMSWLKAGSLPQARNGDWNEDKDFSIGAPHYRARHPSGSKSILGSDILSGFTDQDAAALRINLGLFRHSHLDDFLDWNRTFQMLCSRILGSRIASSPLLGRSKDGVANQIWTRIRGCRVLNLIQLSKILTDL